MALRQGKWKYRLPVGLAIVAVLAIVAWRYVDSIAGFDKTAAVGVSEPLLQYTELTARQQATAKSVYAGVCAGCHNNGRFDAPVIGDTREWRHRLEERERRILHEHAVHGFKRMPPKGGVSQLSDDQIHLAVEYMLHEAQIDPSSLQDN